MEENSQYSTLRWSIIYGNTYIFNYSIAFNFKYK